MTQGLSAEKTALLTILERRREFLLGSAAGLTDDQARERPTVSELCIGGLVKHCTAIEADWVAFLSADEEPDPDAPTDAPTDADAPADPETATDADAPTDHETATDAQMPTDAGAPADAETATDAQTPTDAGAPADAETATDAQTPTDAGAPADAEASGEDWSSGEAGQWEEWAKQFQLLPDETLAGVTSALREQGRKTAAAVSVADLDISHPLPAAPWFEPGASWSGRDALLHIVAELAHHSGHADIIREAIDGRKAMG